MIRLSTGLRAALVTNYGLGSMLNYGRIHVYAGAQPSYANAAAAAQPLAVVCQDGVLPTPGLTAGGLALRGGDEPGTLVNDGAWVLRGMAKGTAGWWRFVWNDPDDGGESSYFPRMDGAVGESLLLASTAITPASTVPITSFLLYLPSE